MHFRNCDRIRLWVSNVFAFSVRRTTGNVNDLVVRYRKHTTEDLCVHSGSLEVFKIICRRLHSLYCKT